MINFDKNISLLQSTNEEMDIEQLPEYIEVIYIINFN